MNNKKAVFSTLFCIFIAALFILGCNNHLLKPQQDEPHLLVRIENSTGARNATTTGEWQISAWIENQDGTKSHQQNVTSASGSEASVTFDDLVIGSQIKIHLEVTKIDDTQTKFTGESGWTTIKEGVNVIVIVLREISSTGEDESDSPASGENQAPDPSTPAEPPAIVNAETPVIGEITSTIKTYTSDPESVTATLKADASVADGGTLTYQWYSSDSPITDSGTAIEGATSATYEATVDAGTTKYFYCVVTNTNDNVNGNKTASATSNIATVASIVGQLDSITAQYIGNHELVNSEINYSNIEIVQVYTIPDAEPQEISVVASSVKDQYTIVLQEPTNAIGNVPATVTHTETKKETTVDIPVKYQLDESNLRITGDTSVDQNGSLSLTANYADDSGSDITYQKYDGGSSTTYNVKDNVTVTWTESATGSSWTATANTTSTGQNTATVTLTSTDGAWCVTTGGIEKSHEYTVLALGSQDNPVTTWEQLTSAIASTTNPIYVDTNSMEATSTIEITGTTEIIPLQSLTITGSSRFFTIGDNASLTLGNDNYEIVLDGNNEQSTEPILYTSGNLTLNSVEVKNRKNTSNISTGGIFIYSGNTTLNNISFSGNTSGLSGAADIYMYQGATQTKLEIGPDFTASEVYFNATGTTSPYPVIQLNQNSSLKDTSKKIKITVGSTSPQGIPVITKNGYTGDLNTLFTIVGSDGTSYSLDETGKIVENTQSSIPENGLSWDSSTSYLTIYNEAGLKNFRDIVNGTLTSNLTVDNQTFNANQSNRTVKATLAADIILNSEEEWTPIGKSGNSSGYAGTFDGAGYTVSGVKISSGTNKGFFGQIESQAKITGLTVAGNISASTYTGGIVGTAAGGTIEYCVNKINVTSSSQYVGGIVGQSQGTTTITGCVNLAYITGDNYIGGIIGHSSSSYAATIDKCINLGSVNSSNTNLSYVGGIQGYSSASSNKITNSLNLGTINNSKGNGAGIICNDTSLTIQYCLSAGTISASSKYAIASNTSGSYTGNYYDSSKITGATTTGGTGKTTSALKVASAWDTSWTTTNWSFAAGRYPVPNIQANIPTTWDEIIAKASE